MVAISEVKMNKKIDIEIENLDVGIICPAYDYGFITDACSHFTHKFTGGNAYAILSEFGAGGWALSCALSGMNHFYMNGIIKINNEKADSSKLREYACYIGSLDQNNKSYFKKKSVYNLLKQSTGKSNYETNSIIELFQLSQERMNRPIDSISKEKLNALFAIGYAQNRTIFCLPWFNTGWLHVLKPRLELCIKVLKDNGSIIIIPTSNVSVIDNLVDESVNIKGPNEILYHNDIP